MKKFCNKCKKITEFYNSEDRLCAECRRIRSKNYKKKQRDEMKDFNEKYKAF